MVLIAPHPTSRATAASSSHKLEREESPRAVPEDVIARDYHFHDDRELGPGIARIQRKNDRRALGAKEVTSVRWLDRCRVLWGLVQRNYDELAVVGRFLLRVQEDEGRRRFPALVKGGGARRKDAREEPPANDTAPEAPAAGPVKP